MEKTLSPSPIPIATPAQAASSRPKLLRGTAVLTSGRMGGYALSFLRNVILARLLTKADYGMAAAFGMTVTVLELSGSMAFGIQVVQSKEGDTVEFQSSANILQFLGGLCSAILIVLLSVPMARLFGVPETWWAFALLAVVPFFQGLNHLDMARRQRDLEFFPIILCDVVPQLLVTVAVWPLAMWLRDFRVLVWLMIGKAALTTAMTFLLAKRAYRWGWDPRHIRSMLAFGGPLLLTGLIMFASSQADQMLVGSVFSLSTLANYALTASVVSIPWFIFSQVASSLALPLMSRAQDNPVQFRSIYRGCLETAAVAGVLCVVPLMVGGEDFIVLVFGSKYAGSGPFVALLGSAFAVRFLRFAPMLAATARADTMNSFYSNLVRGVSLPLAFVAVQLGATPVQIAGCALIGEIAAALVSTFRLKVKGIPLQDGLSAYVYMAVSLLLGCLVAFGGGAGHGTWFSLASAIGALCLAILAAWFTFPEVARFIRETLQKKPAPAAV